MVKTNPRPTSEGSDLRPLIPIPGSMAHAEARRFGWMSPLGASAAALDKQKESLRVSAPPRDPLNLTCCASSRRISDSLCLAQRTRRAQRANVFSTLRSLRPWREALDFIRAIRAIRGRQTIRRQPRHRIDGSRGGAETRRFGEHRPRRSGLCAL